MIVRALFVMTGVIAVLVGVQLPWGEVTFRGTQVPVTFFLDIGVVGTIIAVLGAVFALLGLTEAVSQRSAGVLVAFFGLAITAGAAAGIALIEQGDLDVAPGQVPVSNLVLAPGGFVVLGGGIILVLAGLLFIAMPIPPGPPMPPGGGEGETPPGWYPDIRRSGRLAYWTGSRWTHDRRKLASGGD